MAVNSKIKITAEDKTKAAIKSVQTGMSDLSKKVLSVKGAVLGLAGAGGFGALVISQITSRREIEAYSSALNVSQQQLEAWGYASQTVSIGQEKLADIFKDVSEKIGDAYGNNAGEAAEIIAKLGLNSEKLARLAPDQQLLAIAENLDKLGTRAEKIQALEGLASDASLLLPLLENNAEKLNELTGEAIALGVAVSDVDAEKLRAANDAIFKTGQAIKGAGNNIAVELAPYIVAAGNLFVQSAKDTGGWKDSVLVSVESVVTGIAKVGDVIQGLRFAWAAIKIAFAEAAEAILENMANMTAPIRDLVGLLPGLTDEMKENLGALDRYAVQAADNTKAAWEELDKIALEGLPSEKVKEFFETIRTEAQVTAENMAEHRANNDALNIGSTFIPGSEKMLEDLERLQTYLYDVEQREIESWFKRQEILDISLDNKLISEEEHRRLTEELEAKHLEKLVDLREKNLTDLEKFNAKSWQDQTAQVTGELATMTAGVAQSSEAMFNINKAAGIANAVVSTAAGVAKTLEAYPFPLSIAMAAGQLAAGVAQIQAIKNTTFGGGGTAPSVSGSGSGGSDVVDTIPLDEAQEQGSTNQVYITLEGSSYSDEDVRNLIDNINEQIGDDVTVL